MTDVFGKAELDDDVRDYLIHRLLWKQDYKTGTITNILRMEHSRSIIDLYETYIRISQSVVQMGPSHSGFAAITQGLQRLSCINDFRVEKMLFAIGLTEGGSLPRRDLAIDDLLLTGNVRQAVLNCLAKLSAREADLPTAVSLAMGRAVTLEQDRNEGEFDHHTMETPFYVVRLLESYFRKSKNFERAAIELAKFSRNWQGLPTGAALTGTFGTDLLGYEMSATFSLNTPFVEPRTLIALQGITTPLARQNIRHISDSYQLSQSISFWATLAGLPSAPDVRAANGLSDIARDFALAYAAYAVDDNHTFNSAVDALKSSRIETVRRMTSILTSRFFHRRGDIAATFDLIGNECVSHPEMVASMPIQDAVRGLRWRDIKPIAHVLTTPIVLDLYCRAQEDGLQDRNRRYSFDEFLTLNRLNTPSSLGERVAEFPYNQVIYFLKNLSVPSIMDMSRAFRSSRALEEERRQVCALLCQLDRGRSTTYQMEILSITRSLAIEDGLRLVDSSRVYVDIEAIANWAEREFREDFERYRSLVSTGIGRSEDLEGLLLKILKGADLPRVFLTIPASESDDLLSHLLMDLRDKFLLDPNHGLDSYLSKRIRHGSLSGHLRGPLEEAHLITQRSSRDDGAPDSYRPNEYWIERLNDLAQSDREEVDVAFRQFSSDFDAIIGKLRDSYLHIKTSEHQNGMLTIDLSPSLFRQIRNDVREIRELGPFMSTCLGYFWTDLGKSLEAVAAKIKTEIVNDVANSFQTLRARLALAASYDRFFAELSMSLGTTSAKVQGAIDVVADWFSRRDREVGSKLSTLDQLVEIAIESAKAAHRGFEYQITREVPANFVTDDANLALLADIFFIALDNVYAHCKLQRQAPRVEVVLNYTAETSSVDISITNEVAPGVYSEIVEEELQRLREKIRTRSTTELLTREDGSGLAKLAGIIGDEEQSSLSFGFSSEVEFFLSAKIPIYAVTTDALSGELLDVR